MVAKAASVILFGLDDFLLLLFLRSEVAFDRGGDRVLEDQKQFHEHVTSYLNVRPAGSGRTANNRRAIIYK